MKLNENRPARLEPVQSEINFHKASWSDKDKPKLTEKQTKAVELLRSGKFSAAEMNNRLFCSSGRDMVRSLLKKNIPVLDEWVESENSRFKRFWIDNNSSSI